MLDTERRQQVAVAMPLVLTHDEQELILLVRSIRARTRDRRTVVLTVEELHLTINECNGPRRIARIR